MITDCSISTHILDTHLGRPAQNVRVSLYHYSDDEWNCRATEFTNQDGRIKNWSQANSLSFGLYKLVFELTPYWQRQQQAEFFPQAEICFRITDAGHYHIPLLLAPYSYSTYRGS
ncbi:hydroxyisourate hydrolase [Gayadomonas joobiniege]|uniref:hydroxyisourate hydrolase n=1 Tax=Gayadomonas joobiniege TaxID=1234606 RepID=UPI00035F9E29|nr:hydroxyisourate hydrolase [Gayadomonas joobiniege]